MKIIKLLCCLTAGYFIGTLNPAALISRLKKRDLRKEGTGNLGATNTMLIFGKGLGALVMLFDISKAFFAVKLFSFLFQDITVSGLMAGLGSVLGHIFPFYMKFKGGKGLAPYAGMVLAFDPLTFLFLLVLCTAAILIVNYGIAMPLSAGILFPFLSYMRTGRIEVFLCAAAVSAILIIKHLPNLGKAIRKEDYKVRDVIKNMFSKKDA
ncbi:MAG: glycerol-3-phosphate acyltransferase [Clostridia bacterium]|nr:glycerol-3-phosphate acyltransferase [Clostridia bacterium]